MATAVLPDIGARGNSRDMSVTDEKRAVLERLPPLEPREKHQAMVGIDWAAGVDE